jgi:hypothetical protein
MTRWEIYSLRWSCPFCGSAGLSPWLSWALHRTRKLHPCKHPWRDAQFLAVMALIATALIGPWIYIIATFEGGR